MAGLARNRGVKVAINIFLVIDNVLAWILFSLLPTTKDKKWRSCCSGISTREG
jgi:hypothetical protein